MLHFRFLQFYDEFEGDVAACLTLHNSYALARLAAVEHNAKKKLKACLHMLNSDVFVTEEVNKYCDKIDELFLNGLSSVFKTYRCHAEPIVPTSDLLRLIDKAPQKFGSYWTYRCNQRSVGNDLATRNSLFFSQFWVKFVRRINIDSSIGRW